MQKDSKKSIDLRNIATFFGRHHMMTPGRLGLNEVNLERIKSGFEFQKISKKYKASTDRLKNLVSSFDDSTDIIDYLRGISHNLKF